MFKVDLEKAEEPEIKLPPSVGSSKKQKSSRKTSISALLTMPKPLTVWITTNCEKLFKRWGYQTPWPASWEICMQVKKQQLELDMEQQTGSKSGKEYIKAVYCHPAYLTYMQSTSWETMGWSYYYWYKIQIYDFQRSSSILWASVLLHYILFSDHWSIRSHANIFKRWRNV